MLFIQEAFPDHSQSNTSHFHLRRHLLSPYQVQLLKIDYIYHQPKYQIFVRVYFFPLSSKMKKAGTCPVLFNTISVGSRTE